MIKFNTSNHQSYVVISFQIGDNPIVPSLLKTMQPPDAIKNKFARKGVVLSGRGPIWLYGFLIHFYHPTKWVATYDPRLEGAVVVESHTLAIQVGDIIPIDSDIIIQNNEI